MSGSKNKLLNNVVVKDNYSSVSVQFDESIDTTIPGKYENRPDIKKVYFGRRIRRGIRT